MLLQLSHHLVSSFDVQHNTQRHPTHPKHGRTASEISLVNILYPFSSLFYWSCFPSSSVCIVFHEGFSKSTHKPCFLILWKRVFFSFCVRYFPYSFRAPTLSIVVSIVLGVIRKKSEEKNCHSHRTYTKIPLLLRLFSSFELRSLAAIEGRSRANDDLKYPEYEHEWKNGRKTFSCFSFLLSSRFSCCCWCCYVLSKVELMLATNWTLFFVSDKRGKLVRFSRWGFFSYHFIFLYLLLRIFSFRFRLDNHFFFGLSLGQPSITQFHTPK